MILAVDCRELVPDRVTGIGQFLRGILEEVGQNRPHISMVAVANEVARVADTSRVRVRRFPTRWPTVYADQVLLPKILREVGASVFFSPYYKAPMRAHCHTVVTIHDLIPSTFSHYTKGWRRGFALAFRSWAALMARHATAVITDSEYSKADIVSRLGISSERVQVIPIGVGAEFQPGCQPKDVAQVLRRYGITAPYLLAVANFLPHKNLVRLVEAYSALPAGNRDSLQLVLAGTPARHRVARPVRREALSRPGVMMPGFIAPADLPLLYAGATALVCPSLVEGFGLPVLEAMACGTPVVCARAGALPEVAADAAVYVDPLSVQDIAAAIQRVTGSETLRQDLRARGLARARDFSPRKTTKRLVDFLESVASGNRGA